MVITSGQWRGRRAVFLDRDGVLLQTHIREGRPYAITRREDYALLPGATEGVAALKQAGFVVIVVTNQPDVTTGKSDQGTVDAINQRLAEDLAVDGIRVCIHTDADSCACRKPRPGMLTSAAAELGLDLAASIMVGDRWRDVDAGVNAGCRTIFIDLGYAEALRARPDYTVADFPQAVSLIIDRLL